MADTQNISLRKSLEWLILRLTYQIMSFSHKVLVNASCLIANLATGDQDQVQCLDNVHYIHMFKRISEELIWKLKYLPDILHCEFCSC